jgi:hypothetical protein
LDKVQNDVSTTTAEAMITRVKARVQQGLPVDAETVTTLLALQNELASTALGESIAEATVLAQAASGDFPAAFAGIQDRPNLTPTVWHLLATLGQDSDFLTHAVMDLPMSTATIEPKTVEAIAARLLDLGLPDQAMQWMTAGAQTTGLVFASIALARKDGQAALAALDGDTSAPAADLRAQALMMLGDHDAAAQALKTTSEQGYVLALAQDRNWQGLAQAPKSAWTGLAQSLTHPPAPPSAQPDSFGPLARGLSLVEQSAATRAEIDALLSSIGAN